MALPTNHPFNSRTLTAYTPSCGASPVAAYIRSPFRGRVTLLSGVLGGAITTADGTVTVTNVTQAGAAVGTFTLTQSGSAAGLAFTGTPASPVYVNEGDVLAFTPSGASGANIPLHCAANIRPA